MPELNLAKAGKLSIEALMAAAEQLSANGKQEHVIELYSVWLAHASSPIKFVAWFNFGVVLASRNEYQQAIGAYRSAIELKHDFVQPRVNLGLSLERLGQKHDAIAEWQKIIQDPAIKNSTTPELLTTTLNHIGRVQEDLRDYDQAEQTLLQSLTINPRQKDVIHHWVHLRQKQCKWPVLEELPGVSVNQMLRAMSPLAMLAYADDPALQLLAAENCVRTKFDFPERNLSAGRQYKHDRIRVGYLSGDLCTHAVGLLLPEVFENHDKTNFEVFAFDYSREDGTPVRERFKRAIEHFVPIQHLSDHAAAQLILSNEIDVLVDLHGLSLGARPEILSYRAAPIQATYLGFIGTTALPSVDYVITDRHALPESLLPYYSEKPLYLDYPCLPGDSQREIGIIPTRAEVGLPEGAFVFASFNNSYKLNENMFGCWVEILKRVPNSVIWLVDDNPWATSNLKRYATNQGLAENRLIFSGRVLPPDYRARMKLANLFLDNAPYNAGSTASDVIWMGLPMLTLSGNTFVSRMAGSLLKYVGVPELITHSEDEYVDKAVELATDANHLDQLKDRIESFRLNRGKHLARDIAGSLERLYRNLATSSADAIFSSNQQKAATKSLNAAHTDRKSNGLSQKTGSRRILDAPIELSLSSPVSKASSTPSTCKLYQIAYSEATMASVSPPFIPLDNLENLRSDWQEYWPIRNFLLTTDLDENCLYGFFSPRFSDKTGLTAVQLEQFVLANADRADVITISPQPDMGAFFLNVFEQNELFDPGFLQAAQEFVSSTGLDVNLQSLLMDSRTVVFSNYFVARPRFWRRWLDLNEKLFSICETPKQSPLRAMLLAETTYRNVHRKVFLMERIASLLLTIDPDLRIVTYDTFKCAWSSSKLGSLRSEAVVSDALKIAKSITGHDVYISEFAAVRASI